MDATVYLPLLLPLLAVPVTRWLADRCHPRAATWALVVTAVVVAAASTLSLGLLAVAGLTRVTASAVPVGVVAGVALTAAAVAFVRVGARHVRTLREAYAEARLHPDSDLVVTSDEAPIAYALPGAPGRVVVSTGMLAALDAVEQRVLLAHERAHLANRHHLFLAAAALAAAANPLLRPLRAAVAYTVERWADETAAERVADRRSTARAVGKAALATRRTAAGHPAALHAAAGPVPRRVAALLAEPPTGRGTRFRAVALAAVALLALTAFSSLDAADDLHELFEATGLTAR
ncbi:M56 family metallopeptidase [Umezawaea tangerina]|uniref:Peptidase M48-like protein n=1 Tax=Umezawaea tangerina TaxID=84725 RepID=A0A2T0T1F6_9PSEU|nr:M56 family metallopeptidase [Umezawaea tangerina]PRY39500.1 peptidase M48-like protein [Umezawaea tangerina]